jgi:hypothetical protein
MRGNRLAAFCAAVCITTLGASAQTLEVGTGSARLDGRAGVDEWPEASLVTGAGVTLKAMADGGYLYVSAQWADATESIAKGVWTFDGSAWAKSGDEDRIAFVWDMGLNGADGVNCTTMCHGDGLMRTNFGVVDNWHWKAARGAILGYSDDQYWDVEDRKNDAGTGTYLTNALGGGGLPTYMANGDPGMNADFLADNAATLALFAVSAHASAEAVPFNAGATFPAGAKVPGYVLRTPSGDRASVRTASRWEDGTWTVEFRRPYAGTEHDFEVVPGGSVAFTHEIFDNTGGGHPNDGFDATVYTLDFSLVTATEPVVSEAPRLFELDQNYPNPFNPSTRIAVRLHEGGNLRLEVYDILGRRVRILADRVMPPGNHEFEFDAAGLTSGVYMYVAMSGSTVEARRMALVK